MPGWWFTIESTTTRHFVQQFKMAIEDALKAKPAVRAIMRARATKQRFPVKQWVEDLEKLQSSAIEISHRQAMKEKRPTLDSPSTPAILETPRLMNVLQSRLAKPSLRPRPAAAGATSHLGTLSSIQEGRLLAGPGPGLGSKLGPGSNRKGPRPAMLRNIPSGPVAAAGFATGTKQDNLGSTNNRSRPLMTRSPTAPSNVPRLGQDAEELTRALKRRTLERSSSGPVPQLQMKDRKAVKLLGMQIPASQTNSTAASKHSSATYEHNPNQTSSSEDSPTQASSSSSPGTSLSPSSDYYTPETTPESTPPSSRIHFDPQINTAPTPPSKTAPPIKAANFNVIHTPNAVDRFASKGPHYFPHGSIAVLSKSEIQDEKPDNVLQNVTPFFSDPEKEYEAAFKQKLKKLSGKNSEYQLCIEEYLSKSEKSWFGKRRTAELTKPSKGNDAEKLPAAMGRDKDNDNGFGLGKDYKPPSGLKRLMRRKIGDWPIYSFLLAFVSETRHTIHNISCLSRCTIGSDHSC